MLESLAAAAKVLLYAGLLSACGAVFAAASLHGPAASAYLARLMRRGSILAIAAACAAALLLLLRLGAQLDAEMLAAVFMTGSGAALGMQVAGAGLLLTVAQADDGQTRMMQISYAVLAIASLAFGGHAAAIGPTQGIVAAVHGAAAAWWLASLGYLRHACVRQSAGELVPALQRFTAVALIVVGALVIAGLTLIAILVDFARDPWLLPYGRILMLKLSVVAVALAFATYNRIRLTPRVAAGDQAAVQGLRRSIEVELAAIAAALMVTAVLTTYTSPHD